MDNMISNANTLILWPPNRIATAPACSRSFWRNAYDSRADLRLQGPRTYVNVNINNVMNMTSALSAADRWPCTEVFCLSAAH